MSAAQDTYQEQLLEIASLGWRLVLLSRRSWTTLSLAVVASWGWILVSWSGDQMGALGWALGLVATVAATAWLVTRRRIQTIRQQLGRQHDASRARFDAPHRPLANRPEPALG